MFSTRRDGVLHAEINETPPTVLRVGGRVVVVKTEDMCRAFANASVVSDPSDSPVDSFDVKEDDSNWMDDVNNWGGD